MNIYILAAGSGTRMGQLPVPKPLLPYEGKAIIGHVIETWMEWCDLHQETPKFFVAVRNTDELTMPYLRAAYPEATILAVVVQAEDADKGPIYSMYRCITSGGKQTPFVVTVADCIYDARPFSRLENNLGLQHKTVDRDHYLNCTICLQTGDLEDFVDKQVVGPEWFSWSGVAFIRNSWELASLIEAGMRVRETKVDAAELSYGWLWTAFNAVCDLAGFDQPFIDLGTKEKYALAHANKGTAYDYSKADQITYPFHNSGRVVKYFADTDTAQLFFLRGRAFQTTRAASMFPKDLRVIANFVSHEFLPGVPIESITATSLRALLRLFKHELWPTPKKNVKGMTVGMFDFLFHKKTLSRALTYHMSTRDKLLKQVKRVNGVDVPSGGWVDIIQERKIDTSQFWDHTPRTFLGCTHGDLTFDNILVSSNGAVRLIDWRPQTNLKFPGQELGDMLYDLAKLWVSITIDLNAVRRGEFNIWCEDEETLSWRIEMPKHENYDELIECFKTWCGPSTYTKVERLGPLLLGAMAGVHKPPFSDAIYWYSVALCCQQVHDLQKENQHE